ncbi:flagellar biosynthetic protein FliQ [bacterium]|nr:flagellar biosynthetic protein FliQ [bacterium]
MNEAQAIKLIHQGLEIGILVAGPILLAITAGGLLTSVVQALTQVQEQTVGFVVKVAITISCIWVMGPWMLHRLADHLRGVLEAIAG